MKSVCLVLLLVALTMAFENKFDEANKVERSVLEQLPISQNTTQCVYSSEERRLVCRDGAESVECGVVFDVSALGSRGRFEIFGIERIDNGTEEVHSWVYRLFPRRMDNSTYESSECEVEGRRVRLSLYWSENQVDAGFRVEDRQCYERLVGLFRQSTERHVIQWGPVGARQESVLFGEILVRDRAVQKRWLYGYGFWPYSGLWGWYGYPYSGLFWGRK